MEVQTERKSASTTSIFTQSTLEQKEKKAIKSFEPSSPQLDELNIAAVNTEQFMTLSMTVITIDATCFVSKYDTPFACVCCSESSCTTCVAMMCFIGYQVVILKHLFGCLKHG
jgi:hypothetical protein